MKAEEYRKSQERRNWFMVVGGLVILAVILKTTKTF